MPSNSSSHRKRKKCECKNAYPSLENPRRKWKLVNHPQDSNSEGDSEPTSLHREKRSDEEIFNAESFHKVQNAGTEKSCVCCICNKKFNDVSKERLDEEGYHSASVSMNQLHKPEEHEGKNYRRKSVKELLNENELETIPEDTLPEAMDIRLEPEVVAAAFLASDDEEIDLGVIRPKDMFQKLFSSSLSEEEEISSRNPPNIEEVPVNVQGQSEITFDKASRSQEPQRLKASSTPYRKDSQNSRNLEIPNFGSPIYEEATDADRHDQNEGQEAKHVFKQKTPWYGNRVQLNGSAKPSWFPGFTVVSPLAPEYVRITSDPMEGLREAWRLCQSRHFDEVSKLLVNTGPSRSKSHQA